MIAVAVTTFTIEPHKYTVSGSALMPFGPSAMPKPLA